jgi:hypothetical protein
MQSRERLHDPACVICCWSSKCPQSAWQVEQFICERYLARRYRQLTA